MKRILVGLGLVAALVFVSAPAASAVTDNGTGIFWLYDGANGTGHWRDYNMGPSGLHDLTSATYVQGGSMNNTVSSIVFSCGASGSAIDPGDNVVFYAANNGTGTSQIVAPNYPSECSNGVIKRNLTTDNNIASSFRTNDH
jgi:hypothetical protein